MHILHEIYYFATLFLGKFELHHSFVYKGNIVVYNYIMEDKKYYIDAVLEKEKQRNQNMRTSYERRMLTLPKGTLAIREINGRRYCYLRYREGKKTIQKYAGTFEHAHAIREKIAEREHLAKLIRMLEEEHMRILKMEAIR